MQVKKSKQQGGICIKKEETCINISCFEIFVHIFSKKACNLKWIAVSYLQHDEGVEKKMKHTKWIGLALMVLMAVTMFAGCAPADDGVLTMATNAYFPPYEYYEGGEVVGIDAEIGAALAAKLGMKFQIEDMEFGSIISAVQSGKADVGIAGMTVDEDRLVSVNFTKPYATGHQVIITKEGSDIKEPDDLEGKKVGVQQDTTGDIYITDQYGDSAVDRYNKGADAVQALTQGKVDAVVIDLEPAKSFVEANEGLVILETEYAAEDYAIAVNKKNTDLLQKLNKALEELTADGTIQAILDKYIPA